MNPPTPNKKVIVNTSDEANVKNPSFSLRNKTHSNKGPIGIKKLAFQIKKTKIYSQKATKKIPIWKQVQHRRPSLYDDDGRPIRRKLQKERKKQEKSKNRFWKKSGGRSCWKVFPCCCKVPREVGIELSAVFDLIYGTVAIIFWTTILGLDLFAEFKRVIPNQGNHTSNLQTLQRTETAAPYIDPTSTMGTTSRLPWTLRTTTQPPPLFDTQGVDVSHASEYYSKIATMVNGSHSEIKRGCGHDYFEKYLYHHKLARTKNIWDDFLWYTIAGEILFVALGSGILISVCCFIENQRTKFFLMGIWYVQWVPIILQFQAIILSQSKRLCVIQYMWSHNNVKGQYMIMCGIFWRLVIFKPYQLLLLFFYIKELLSSPYVFHDESEHLLVPEEHQTVEANYSQAYFTDFYRQDEWGPGKTAGGLITTHPSESGLSDDDDDDEEDEDQVSEAQTVTDVYNI